MLISFVLSMPRNNAWNGRWTGESRFFAKVIDIGKSKKALAKVQNVLDIGYFRHSFGDGWVAGVGVSVVDTKEARRIRRESIGFCGYDWMIDSILDIGKIEV